MADNKLQDGLHARPSLVPGISDATLSLIVPVAAHWITAAFYEVVQRIKRFDKYKIHSSQEQDKRNVVSRLECLGAVLTIQILQTGLGLVFAAVATENVAAHGTDDGLAVWQRRVAGARAALGVDALVAWTDARDEMLAKAIYYGLVPALRFYVALWLADTWVFFIHRAEHSNRWVYKKFHSRHHEIYVPYSWGGLYDHPLENLFLSVGAFALAVVGTGMSLRESIFFSAFSSVKVCTDHGGYRFPWNPVDAVTTVDSDYHDKHHQRWGLKTNFALHFQFWDRVFGTAFCDTQAAARLYARDRDRSKEENEKAL